MNILVTGSNGFIAKNLISTLQKQGTNILPFTRDDNTSTLKERVRISDYIIHLAGEVRPQSSDDEFHASNAGLTQLITQQLTNEKLNTPIILASTIHAKLQKNEYGKSKRLAEILVEEYSNKTGANCHILRLPHVFGPGCKVNYNSVISTWIVDTIQGKEINVYDREIKMQYVYVIDVVKDMINLINENNENLYLTPSIIYPTTLGIVADLIAEFNMGITSSTVNNELAEKIYDTFLSYKKQYNDSL